MAFGDLSELCSGKVWVLSAPVTQCVHWTQQAVFHPSPPLPLRVSNVPYVSLYAPVCPQLGSHL